MRVFIALSLPDAILDRLCALQAMLPAGRRMARDTLHLTLAFLGEQPDDLVETVHHALEDIRAATFDLTLSGLGTFGDPRAHLIYVGAASSPGLDALHKHVVGAVRAAGVVPERRRFRPHVTLARFGTGLSPGETAAFRHFIGTEGGQQLPPFTVDHMTLFSSERRPSGAHHHALAHYPLGSS